MGTTGGMGTGYRGTSGRRHMGTTGGVGVRFFFCGCHRPTHGCWVFFEERPTFFQNDHCTARGSQHLD